MNVFLVELESRSAEEFHVSTERCDGILDDHSTIPVVVRRSAISSRRFASVLAIAKSKTCKDHRNRSVHYTLVRRFVSASLPRVIQALHLQTVSSPSSSHASHCISSFSIRRFVIPTLVRRKFDFDRPEDSGRIAKGLVRSRFNLGSVSMKR